MTPWPTRSRRFFMLLPKNFLSTAQGAGPFFMDCLPCLLEIRRTAGFARRYPPAALSSRAIGRSRKTRECHHFFRLIFLWNFFYSYTAKPVTETGLIKSACIRRFLRRGRSTFKQTSPMRQLSSATRNLRCIFLSSAVESVALRRPGALRLSHHLQFQAHAALFGA